MTAETSGRGAKLFPKMEICVGTRAPTALRRWGQFAVLSALVAMTGALAYLGVSRISYKRHAAEHEAAISRVETANADLQKDNAGLRRDDAGLRKYIAGLQRALVSLAQQRKAIEEDAASKDGRIGELTRALGQSRQAADQEQAKHATLTAQLSKIAADRAAGEVQFAQYKASVEETVKQLQQLSAARGRAAGERSRLRMLVSDLWQKLSQEAMPLAQPVDKSPAEGSAAAPHNDMSGTNSGPGEISRFERALAAAGVDANRLYAQFGGKLGEGGPFVPPPAVGHPLDTVDPKKLEAIRGLEKVLPLTAPLANYQIGSPFGLRTDPFNGRVAFHTGIDMDAPYKAPVYSTAPGTVVYAGYFGDYGKVVEIYHGFGIDTLYAHLQRYFVSVGQKVSALAEIGLVGTTGRSSGPHVHYEVRVDGQPQDPEKFIGLLRLIPIVAGPLTP
jgi:murein DD-endopeptidase MepM/ murein hydrolase activator NlpD